jgi:hypothetical protein
VSDLTRQELVEAFEYLDQLRESGQTNMWRARDYVVRELAWPKHEAGEATKLWMRTFSAASVDDRVTQALASPKDNEA